MEQAHAREGHSDAVLVAGHDDMVVAHRATSLGNELHAALVGTLNVVAEGEEGVAAAGHPTLGGDPGFLFLRRKHLRLDPAYPDDSSLHPVRPFHTVPSGIRLQSAGQFVKMYHNVP